MYNAKKARENNEIGIMLKNQRKSRKLRQTDVLKLLEECGISITAANYSNWETGISCPNAYQYRALCQIYGIKEIKADNNEADNIPGYNNLNNVGKAMVRQYAELLKDTGNYAVSQSHRIDYIKVKTFDIPCSAGYGMDLSQVEEGYVQLPSSIVPEGTDYCLKISGDSMYPRYEDGSYAFIKKTKEIAPGETGIFMYNGDAYIKKLDYYETDDNMVYPLLVSINKKYSPIYVEENSNFRCLGKVLN